MPKPKQLTVQCRLGVFQRFIYCCAISHVSNNLSHPLIGLCRFSLISMESGECFSQCSFDDVTKPYDKPWVGIHVYSLSFSFFYIFPWALNSVYWLHICFIIIISPYCRLAHPCACGHSQSLYYHCSRLFYNYLKMFQLQAVIGTLHLRAKNPLDGPWVELDLPRITPCTN